MSRIMSLFHDTRKRDFFINKKKRKYQIHYVAHYVAHYTTQNVINVVKSMNAFSLDVSSDYIVCVCRICFNIDIKFSRIRKLIKLSQVLIKINKVKINNYFLSLSFFFVSSFSSLFSSSSSSSSSFSSLFSSSFKCS